MTFQQVKDDIYNYRINKATMNELLEQSRIKIKMSQTLSDMPRGGGDITDNVCCEVFRRLSLESRIKKLNENLVYIDKAMCVLNEFEYQIIDYIKQGYKMSRIAVIMKCQRSKVVYSRDKAIDKMLQYVNRNEKVYS